MCENKPPCRGSDGLIRGNVDECDFHDAVADEMSCNKVVHLELYLEFSDTNKALSIYR